MARPVPGLGFAGHRRVLSPAVVVAVLGGAISAAQAQRGGDYIEQAEPAATPLTGFPGLFDTNMALRGEVVADLPLGSIDYGVTENFTVGTYAIWVLGLAGGQYFPSLKARYRLYSRGPLEAVVHGLALYLDVGDDETETDELRGWMGVGGVNVSYHLAPRHLLTGSLLGGRMSLNGVSEGDTVLINLNGFIAGVSYQFNVTPRFTTRVALLSAPLIWGETEAEGLLGTVSFGALEALTKRTVLRVMVDLKPGVTWLLSGGGLLHPSGEVIPWLSVAKRFR